MHDYDRRPTTASSAETLNTIHWSYVDHEKLAESALRAHQARPAKYDKVAEIRDNVVLITGTTTDGRTFRIEATYFLKDWIIQSEARTVVEGAVSMGPVPSVLSRVEASVLKLLEALTNLGLVKSDYRSFANGWAIVAKPIEAWRSGDVVDTKALRSSLNSLVKDIKVLTDNLRKKYPGDPQLGELLDEARKAVGAAARGIPDIG